VFSISFHLTEKYSLSKMLPSFHDTEQGKKPRTFAKHACQVITVVYIPKGFTCLYEAIILTFCSTNYFLNSNNLVQINFPNELESSVFKQQPISG